jgi:hypothetical protein
MLSELDRRLQYGPGMRAQRLVEAFCLLLAIFTTDLRYAYVTLALSVLQAVSGRLVPVAWAVAAFVPAPSEHRLSDLYYDLAGTRGACAISVIVQLAGIGLVRTGLEVAGYLVLTVPTASFVLAPTVGFCCGCSVYVGLREVLVRLGVSKRYANDTCDVAIRHSEAPSHQ